MRRSVRGSPLRLIVARGALPYLPFRPHSLVSYHSMLRGEIEMLRGSIMSRRGSRYCGVTAACVVAGAVFATGLTVGCGAALAAPPSVLLFVDRDLGEAATSGLDHTMPSPMMSDAAADQACAAAPAGVPRF